MARTSTNLRLKSLGRGLCLGRSELGPGNKKLLSLLHQSVFRTLTPSSSCTSPLTRGPRLPPLTCPLPFGQVRGGGAPSTLGLGGEGKVLRRGTRVWLELPQPLTLGSRKGRGCRPNEKQENICVTLASSGSGEGPGGRAGAGTQKTSKPARPPPGSASSLPQPPELPCGLHLFPGTCSALLRAFTTLPHNSISPASPPGILALVLRRA